MPSVSVPTAILGAGALSAAGGAAGSLISGSAAERAAKAQSQAYLTAAATQQHAFEQSSANLQPFIQAGQQNLPAYSDYWKTTQPYLQQAVDEAHAAIPGPMTEATIKQTPGYGFVYDQTMKAINNTQAAKGLGASGAAMKQGSTWATGLANTTYQNQFNMQQQRFSDTVQNLQNRLAANNQTFNQLGAPVTLGANVGSNLANTSANVYNAIGNAGIGSGQALGAGIAAQGNAYAGGINNLSQTAGNTLQGYAMSPYIMNALQAPYNPYAQFGPAGVGGYGSAMNPGAYANTYGNLQGNPLY